MISDFINPNTFEANFYTGGSKNIKERCFFSELFDKLDKEDKPIALNSLIIFTGLVHFSRVIFIIIIIIIIIIISIFYIITEQSSASSSLMVTPIKLKY